VHCGTSIGARRGKTSWLAKTASSFPLPSAGALDLALKGARQVAHATSPEPAILTPAQIYDGRRLPKG
jgi:hypothetical protein